MLFGRADLALPRQYAVAMEESAEDYTLRTREWLDRRFRATSSDGIYFAHQPIYGLRGGHCEPGLVSSYVITYRILEALSRIEFDSLLDVGGAEGYKAALVREVFGAEVRSVDLSKVACDRARELFGVESEPADIHELPFDDSAFDVVLSSETLEHVPHFEQATRELLRVARRGVVITVPREAREVVERNIREDAPHAHIHALDTHSFDFLRPELKEIRAGRLLSPLLRLPRVLVDATAREEGRHSPFSIRSYNRLIPSLRALFGKRAARSLVRLDGALSRVGSFYTGIIFVLIKDASAFTDRAGPRVRAADVLDFEVPYHRLPT